jgi:hypothetical protein
MTAMHPATGYYQMNHNHIADLRHQAQRHALARAARRARRARRHQPSLHRLVLSALAR